jgi:hypothetical protein
MRGTENADYEYAPPYPAKCTVLCAASAVCIVGSVSLKDSVDSERYGVDKVKFSLSAS